MPIRLRPSVDMLGNDLCRCLAGMPLTAGILLGKGAHSQEPYGDLRPPLTGPLWEATRLGNWAPATYLPTGVKQRDSACRFPGCVGFCRFTRPPILAITQLLLCQWMPSIWKCQTPSIPRPAPPRATCGPEGVPPIESFWARNPSVINISLHQICQIHQCLEASQGVYKQLSKLLCCI